MQFYLALHRYSPAPLKIQKERGQVRLHPDDSSWVFLSDGEYDNLGNVAKIVALGQMIKIDSSILEIADMKVGIMLVERQSKTNGRSKN